MRRILVFILLFPCLVWGQKRARSKSNQRIIRGTVINQSFAVEDVDEKMTELSFPIQVLWPVNPDLSLQVFGVYGSSQYGDYKLSGLSDIYVKTNYLFMNKKAMVGLGFGVPTGVTEMNDEQFMMARMLSNNALRFQLPVFGRGFSSNFGVCFAHPASKKITIGGGFSYIYRAGYKPVEDSYDNYNPGDVFELNLGSDIQIQEDKKLFVDFLYTLYLKDKIRDRESFGAGAKLGLEIGFLMNMELITVLANATFRQKSKNEFWTGSSLEAEMKNSNGPQFEFDSTVRYLVNEQTGAMGFAILRAFGENEYRTGDAAIFGLGGGFDYLVSPQLVVDAAVKYYFGRLGGGSNALSINGLEILFGGDYSF